MKRKLPKRFVPVAVGVGLLLVALIGWLAVVRPQQSKAAKLANEVESVRYEITQNRILARPRTKLVAVRLADVFRLTKAMPGELDMPGILLELNRVAGESGITFESITPQAEATLAGYRMVSIQLVLNGNYYELSDLLFRLRNLVEVHNGELSATGRLFTVGSVDFVEGPDHFPQLKATLVVNAYVYGAAPVPGDPAAPPVGGSTTPAPAETSPAPATAPSGATAAGVTP